MKITQASLDPASFPNLTTSSPSTRNLLFYFSPELMYPNSIYITNVQLHPHAQTSWPILNPHPQVSSSCLILIFNPFFSSFCSIPMLRHVLFSFNHGHNWNFYTILNWGWFLNWQYFFYMGPLPYMFNAAIGNVSYIIRLLKRIILCLGNHFS